ncbi:MAG: CPP1-like family protein [Cyanobacteriota bacterium]|nr:CPP1-like family protein [Cyanobacteriota bacterium]
MTEGSPDPYKLLGIAPESSFEDVQTARQAKLDAVGDDPMARSRVEAAYDAILMDRLKERQAGRVSSAARSASQKETAPATPRPSLAQLPQLPSLPLPRLGGGVKPGRPLTFSLATGRERWFPLIAHGTLLVLALALPSAAPDSLLALGALATVVNLVRRNGGFFRAVGWTLLLLVVGLGLSLALFSGLALPANAVLWIQPVQVQTALALLLLLLGALFIG